MQDREQDHVLEPAPLHDALAQESFASEADPFQEVSGGAIAFKVVGMDSIESELTEGEVQEGFYGFGGVTVAPPGFADPDPQLRLVVFPFDVAQGDAADERSVGEEADGKVCGAVFEPGSRVGGDPAFSCADRVGVGDRHGGIGDLAGPGQFGDAAGIGRHEGSEEQPGGSQGRLIDLNADIHAGW